MKWRDGLRGQAPLLKVTLFVQTRKINDKNSNYVANYADYALGSKIMFLKVTIVPFYPLKIYSHVCISIPATDIF